MTKLDYEPRRRGYAFSERSKRILLLLAGGVVLFPPIFLAMHLVALSLPFGWDAFAYVNVPTSQPNEYGSRAEFYISAFGSGRGSWTKLDWAWLIYGSSVPGREAMVDLHTLTLYDVDPIYGGRISPRPLSPDAIEVYVSRVGINEREARDLASTIDLELRKLASGDLRPDVRGRPVVSAGPNVHYEMKAFDGFAEPAYLLLGELGVLFWWPWHLALSIPLWLLAWFFMARRVMRRPLAA